MKFKSALLLIPLFSAAAQERVMLITGMNIMTMGVITIVFICLTVLRLVLVSQSKYFTFRKIHNLMMRGIIWKVMATSILQATSLPGGILSGSQVLRSKRAITSRFIKPYIRVQYNINDGLVDRVPLSSGVHAQKH